MTHLNLVLTSGILATWLTLIIFIYITQKNVDEARSREHPGNTIEISCKCPDNSENTVKAITAKAINEVVKAIHNEPKMISSEIPSTETHMVAKVGPLQKKGSAILNPPLTSRLSYMDSGEQSKLNPRDPSNATDVEKHVTIITNESMSEYIEKSNDTLLEGYSDSNVDFVDYEEKEKSNTEAHTDRGAYKGTIRGSPEY